MGHLQARDTTIVWKRRRRVFQHFERQDALDSRMRFLFDQRIIESITSIFWGKMHYNEAYVPCTCVVMAFNMIVDATRCSVASSIWRRPQIEALNEQQNNEWKILDICAFTPSKIILKS